MQNSKLIIANWKMNLTAGEAKAWLSEFSGLPLTSSASVVICPAFTTLAQIFTLVPEHVALGAQNCYFQPKGAYTGEIAINMLQELKVQYILLGHSERRALFGEDDQLIKQKLEAVLNTSSINPVLCVGESLAQRENNKWQEHIYAQLKVALAVNTETANLKRVIVAYEPIWAIGSGKSATLQEITEVHQFIRKAVAELRPEIKQLRVLYGGSVKAANSAELLASSEIDGLLVGGASLKPSEFNAIINNLKHD